MAASRNFFLIVTLGQRHQCVNVRSRGLFIRVVGFLKIKKEYYSNKEKYYTPNEVFSVKFEKLNGECR